MPEQAELQMDELRQGADNGYLFHITRGWMHWRNRDWVAASMEYQQILKENESNQFLLANYSDCLRRLQQYDEALSLLTPAAGQLMTPYLLQARIGQTLLDMQNHREAKERFTTAHEILDSQMAKSYRDKSAVYLHNKAWIFAQSGDTSRALEFLQQSIEHGHKHYADLLHRPDWDRFLDNPLFISLVEKMKFLCQNSATDEIVT